MVFSYFVEHLRKKRDRKMNQEEFQSLLPQLTDDEIILLEQNQLELIGIKISRNPIDTEMIFLIPTPDKNYWIWVHTKLSNWSEEYTPRGILLSAIPFDWFDSYEYEVKKTMPLCKYPPHFKKEIPDMYVIQDVHNGGPVKIGISWNVWKRLDTFQTGYPYSLKVVRIFNNVTAKQEHAIHAKLKQYKLHGEWFNASAIAVVDKLMQR